jgi:hypothetical protein
MRTARAGSQSLMDSDAAWPDVPQAHAAIERVAACAIHPCFEYKGLGNEEDKSGSSSGIDSGGMSAAWAQMTPVGTWRSMDEKENTPKAEVKITEAGWRGHGQGRGPAAQGRGPMRCAPSARTSSRTSPWWA